MNDGPGTEMDDAVEDQSPSVNDFVTKVVDTIATSVRYFFYFFLTQDTWIISES
jgi:hypothetical protein